MSGQRSALTILAILTALSTSWTLPSQTQVRPVNHYFVLDPTTGHGFIATAETVAACAMPTYPTRSQPTPCGGAGSPCGAAPANSPSRTCGTTAACGIVFALGQLAMHTADSAVLPDDGSLPEWIEAEARFAATRYLSPPQPPPRTV